MVCGSGTARTRRRRANFDELRAGGIGLVAQSFGPPLRAGSDAAVGFSVFTAGCRQLRDPGPGGGRGWRGFVTPPPWNPFYRAISRRAEAKSLRVLEAMQPASGGFLEATPLTSFVVMSLASSQLADHPVTRRGLGLCPPFRTR